MNEDELKNFYDELTSLTEKGTEADVRAYIKENFARLPENIRDRIVFDAFSSVIEEEAKENEAIANIQEQGIAAVESLEEAREELKNQAGA